MVQSIEEELFSNIDEKYRDFNQRLLPGVSNILGVRFPILRKIAKNIAKNNGEYFFTYGSENYFEEIMIKGMIIGYIKVEPEEKIKLIENYLHLIDNWSICDSFCVGLKFTVNNQLIVWELIDKYFFSTNEYEIRFAVVMCLNYFINDEYIDKVLDKFNNICISKYYAQMAVAWAISMCYVKYREKTTLFLQNNSNLDVFTYNKAIQKVCESHVVSKEEKELIKRLKKGELSSNTDCVG